MDTIYILLPTHNRATVTVRFVDCLKFQTHSKYELILIDDASSDNTIDVCLGLMPRAHVLLGDGNLWWAGSLQKGIEYLDGVLKPRPIVTGKQSTKIGRAHV